MAKTYKYNTLEELLEAMERRVNRTVKSYKSDFDVDRGTLGKSEPGDSFCWMVRKLGTQLVRFGENLTEEENADSLEWWEACKRTWPEELNRFNIVHGPKCWTLQRIA